MRNGEPCVSGACTESLETDREGGVQWSAHGSDMGILEANEVEWSAVE